MTDSNSQMAAGVTAASAAVIIAAMIISGSGQGDPLQAIIQTSPLWLLVVFGWRGGGYARWTALPLLGFWLVVSGLVWAEGMGWSHLASAALADLPAPVAAVTGGAAAVGLLACLARHERISPLTGLTLALASGALQIGAFYLGMQPSFFIS